MATFQFTKTTKAVAYPGHATRGYSAPYFERTLLIEQLIAMKPGEIFQSVFSTKAEARRIQTQLPAVGKRLNWGKVPYGSRQRQAYQSWIVMENDNRYILYVRRMVVLAE